VYASHKTWQELQRYPITDRYVIEERTAVNICGISFEAFPVEHSILSPAVGYRLTAGRARIFYAPDVIFIHERKAALDGVQLYIGDGATVTRSFIRKRGRALIGHSPVRTQLTWCQKEGVPRAIITHCGSEIVTGDERGIFARIQAMAAERRIDACIAYDGMELRLRGRHTVRWAPLGIHEGRRARGDAPYQTWVFRAYLGSCGFFYVAT
jgi:hypothetical protein